MSSGAMVRSGVVLGIDENRVGARADHALVPVNVHAEIALGEDEDLGVQLFLG